MPTSGEVTTRSDRMRNFKMFWDIFKKILKVEFQLRTWGVLLGLSNTAGVLAGVFGIPQCNTFSKKGSDAFSVWPLLQSPRHWALICCWSSNITDGNAAKPSDSLFNDHRQAVPQRPQPPPFFPENHHSVDNFGPFVETQSLLLAFKQCKWKGNLAKLLGNFSNSWTHQDQPAVLPYDFRKNVATKNVDAQAPKRTSSPPIPSADEVSQENSHFSRNDSKRPSPSPPRLGTRSNNLSKALDSGTPHMHLPSARSIGTRACLG
ncbi:hypothetical protein LOK49_LG08G03082 [Camellia lanceoleosa]|uniref:Uncharacterized protein n=1 Tax=Camellia lanceoleosa TaxID=1840588 RepID=A0ACC0GZE0_9ERIC|nr:hypothetical protein LOK49_LG08G03082 [Camellia lanceoleosa]